MKARPASAWSQDLDDFRAALADSGRSAATCDSYRLHADWLSSGVEGDPWSVTPGELQAWLDGRAWSAHTRRKVLVSLRAFYAWGIDDGRCMRSPLAGLSALPPRPRGPHRSKPSPLWAEPVESYLTWLRSGARLDSTAEQRRWWLTRLSETYANPWQVTATDLARWLSRDDWSPQTKRLARSSVQTFYRWAELTGRVALSPARDLASVLVRRALPRPAPDDAVQEALEHASDRVRLAITVAALAGLRRAEIARIHTRDIGDDQLLVHGKGGIERLVPLHPDLRTALRAEIRRRREGRAASGWGATVPSPDGWLFPSDDADKHLTPAHLGKLVAAVLPGSWTTHQLRHRFATQAFAAERDLRAVQELLGHAKPETTAVYAAVPDGALRTAVAGVGL